MSERRGKFHASKFFCLLHFISSLCAINFQECLLQSYIAVLFKKRKNIYLTRHLDESSLELMWKHLDQQCFNDMMSEQIFHNQQRLYIFSFPVKCKLTWYFCSNLVGKTPQICFNYFLNFWLWSWLNEKWRRRSSDE